MRRVIQFITLVTAISIGRPAFAQTATCRDGTTSYSAHRSGTCSHDERSILK